MSNTLVSVRSVKKRFCRSLKRSLFYAVHDIAAELRPRMNGPGMEGDRPVRLRAGEFWAVDDVSFELRKGECIGLIGHNGAGKTTLLKMLNGLIKPDHGLIEMRGRVGALIALGAGFNPLLSGRENIFVNASVLGIRRGEVEARIDEIIDFSDIREFIDSPVQSYSSGMQVRLGFAIATAFEPDILLLDEVLAVGDAAFRHKCYHRLNKIASNAAVILVSHSMDYIAQMCTSVLMMHRGKARLFADPTEGIAAYNQENRDRLTGQIVENRVEKVYHPVKSATVRIADPLVHYKGRLEVEIDFDMAEAFHDAVASFTAVNLNEQPVMCWNTSRNPEPFNLCAGKQTLRFSVEPLLLHDGDYFWNFNVSKRGSIEHVVWFMRAGKFTVTSRSRPIGNIPYIPDSSSFELVSNNSAKLLRELQPSA